MTTCPPPDRLADLLSITAPVDVETLGSHVRDCSACQTILDHLTDDRELRSWRPPVRDRRDSSIVNGLAPPRRDGDLAALGSYRLQKLLGQGGMGLVFLAFDESLSRPVALKILRSDLDHAEIRDRFTREAKAAAAIRHDHVVTVFGVSNPAEGLPHFAMEFLDGPSLATKIGGKPLPVREAAEWMAQIADGLAAAHAAGLIHRDVKPANILIDAKSGRAKIVDFGLARTRDVLAGLTQDGAIVGTPHYLSPEQADPRLGPIDARSDIYSLGVTLFEALTGSTPFRGTALSVVNQVLNETPPNPRALNPDIPRDLETICLKAMAREPHRRYATMPELRDDLRRWLNGQPILARPAGVIERSYRWMVRNPLPVSLMAVFLIGLVASSWGWGQSRQNAIRAEARERDAIAAQADADRRSEIAREKTRLAEARSQSALKSITTLIERAKRISGTDPKSLAIQRELTQAALSDLQKLADEVERTPEPDAGIAQAMIRLGESFYSLGKVPEAESNYQKAQELAERLTLSEPDDFRHPLYRAQATLKRGRIALYRGDYVKSRAAFTTSLEWSERARALNPEDPSVIRELALGWTALGDVGFFEGTTLPAIRDYEQALNYIRELINRDPSQPSALSDARFVHGRLAQCLAIRFRFDDAYEHLNQAERAAQAALPHATDRSTAERDLRIVQLDRLQLLVRRCDWTRAEAMAREIIRQCETASAGQPDDAVLRRDVAVGNNMLAVALNGLKRYDEAMAAMEISYQKRLGLNQAELIEVCWLGVDTCGRAGQFLRAADWSDRGAEAVKALMDQKQANLYQISERQRFLSYGLAYRALPKTLETPSHLDSLPPAVALRARGIRGIFAARTGVRDLAKADEHILRESKDIEARQFHAVICILLSELTQDPNEKAEFGKRGMEQLSSVLRQYPSVIQLLYLYPELDSVRQSPEFTALRQELVK